MENKPKSRLAIASFVIGLFPLIPIFSQMIIGFVLGIVLGIVKGEETIGGGSLLVMDGVVRVLLGITAIILGAKASRKIKNEASSGERLAKAGIIFGILTICFTILYYGLEFLAGIFKMD